MQAKKAAKLHKEWVEKGNPPCDHVNLDKEYDLGADTGDLVCTSCGETWWRNNPNRPTTDRFPAKKAP
jgi:hypothetical protein